MEWASSKQQPKEITVEEIKKDTRKVIYGDQKALDAKYKNIIGCRYPCNSCVDSFRRRKCCHQCDREDTCKHACLSKIEDCQSVLREEK